MATVSAAVPGSNFGAAQIEASQAAIAKAVAQAQSQMQRSGDQIAVNNQKLQAERDKLIAEIQNSQAQFGRAYPQGQPATVTADQLQFSGAPDAAALDRRARELDDKIRELKAKLRDLGDRQAGDQAQNPADPGRVVDRLSDEIADTESQRAKQQALLNKLLSLGPSELRQTLPTVVPDSMLSTLMQDEFSAEAKLVQQKANLGAMNPDVVTTSGSGEEAQ